MAKGTRNKPATYKSITKTFKARKASTSKEGLITKRTFVTADKKPRVKTKIVAVESVDGDREGTTYEIRLDIDGTLIGERSHPYGLKSKEVTKRIPSSQLSRQAKQLDAFVPKHLAIDPLPRQIIPTMKRVPAILDDSLKYNTTIFGTDDRRVFRDTSYPWSCFGRCETNLGPFSGVMIGPRHILTCNHGVDWTPPPGYAADWLKFTPAYFNGDEPFGSSYATHVYWIKKDNNDGFSNGDEDQYDYVVLVLSDRLGDATGYLGARRYTDSWDGLEAWWHIGYPSDLTSVERPTYQSWFSMDGDDGQSDDHQAIYHKADVFPGQSGGPMFGFWDGDVGPRAVAVQSWQNSSTNGASGGGDLVDLVVSARSDFA